jgi:Tol biopolymer transport system component
LYGSDALDFGGIDRGGAVSPDGRWLVYNRGEMSAERMNLWIVPLDGTREAVRLTTGTNFDADPIWFPSGDRILFRSTRFDPGGDFQYLSTLDIDPAAGGPTSVPRQITLEPVLFTRSYRISPDGRQIVYVARPSDPSTESFKLKVVPANGGSARTVWQQPEGLMDPAWKDDGNLYFLSGLVAARDEAGQGLAIRRVPAAGGEPETLSTWPGIARGQLSADAEHFVYRTSPQGSREAVYEVGSVDGRRLASFVLPENMSLASCFTVGGIGCLATTEDVAAPLKVIPVRGGPVRQLTETRGLERPLGWTPNGREIVFQSQIDGTKVIMASPMAGGIARQLYRLPPEEWVYGPSLLGGRYALYGAQAGADSVVALTLLDLQTGSKREITRTPWTNYTRYNSSRDGDRFLYAVRRQGRFEFRSISPGGESTLLRAFPDSVSPPILGVRGDRIAYWVESDGTSTLYLARAGEREARKVLTFPGSVGQRGSSSPTWSPDGRYLVTGYRRPETNTSDALVVELDASGKAVGDPRVFGGLPEIGWWNLTWLPTSDAFLVASGDVWLVPLDPGAAPVKLTDEGSSTTWGFELSPDGQYLAVAPEVRRGGSIWRLDLGAALRTLSRR